MPKVCIIGATTFGITLGVVLAKKRLEVKLLARTEEEAAELRANHHCNHNAEALEGIVLPKHLSVTSSPEEALDGACAVLLVVPSQTMRQNVRLIKDYIDESMLVISAAKGIESESNKRMSQVIGEEIPSYCLPNICVLSGPNLAKEILCGSPAATVIAASDESVAKKAQRLIVAHNFCVYTNTDIVGTELGGALKNIIALGAGMADGLGYGDNAKAAFITRGLTEITALGVTLGANPLTFSGLAGLGDLVATCASPLSRNHYVGYELAKGKSLDKIVASMKEVAEGINATKAAWTLAQKHGVEMPIIDKIYRVLYQGLSPKQAAEELIGAEVGHELVGRRWKLFSFTKLLRR
ncbi:MAG: NAD(P)-dependent glycerol-3-phosphate dehydrogenase [Chloroflexi bacterium]|nr:NAD(P)-dependent glycerol-3-phosphate dehydrogenase [Chloroflexota bacterium]